MSYFGLEYDRAISFFERHTRNEPWDSSNAAHEIQSSEQFDASRAEALYRKLDDLRQAFPLDALPRNRAKDFEAGASGIVHRELNLGPEAAATPDFWAWLTFCAVGGALANLVKWRFGTEEGHDPRNYGITTPANTFEGLFARLWFRGEIAYDPGSSDPYDLAKRGDVDIWRSHIIRPEFARCPIVRRELIRYQYPDASGKRTLRNLHLRELVKLIRIGEASLAYELLDEKEVSSIIDALAKKAALQVNAEAGSDEE